MPKVKAGAHPLAHRAARAKYLMDARPSAPATPRSRRASAACVAAPSSLVSPEMAQAAGYNPSAVPSSATIASASPFGRRMNPTLRRADRRARLLRQRPPSRLPLRRRRPRQPLGARPHGAEAIPFTRREGQGGGERAPEERDRLGQSSSTRASSPTSWSLQFRFAPQLRRVVRLAQLRAGVLAAARRQRRRRRAQTGPRTAREVHGPRWRNPIAQAKSTATSTSTPRPA